MLACFMSAVDKQMTYIPVGAAILGYFLNYDPVESAIAAFSVATFLSLMVKLIRSIGK